MAGHSKWANIQHRKGRQDEKRGKVWTRVIREIMVAARAGGADMNINPRLRLAVDKAKAANMPADTIKRNIDKATGNLEGVHYEEIRYEGYGVGGVALMVDTMTDNKVRTVAEVRHALSKHGGNLGSDGSVAYQFKHCGQFIFAPGSDEDRLMEVALEAGADDVINSEDGAIEVLCSPSQFEAVKQALEGAQLQAVLAEIPYRPETTVALAANSIYSICKMTPLAWCFGIREGLRFGSRLSSTCVGFIRTTAIRRFAVRKCLIARFGSALAIGKITRMRCLRQHLKIVTTRSNP